MGSDADLTIKISGDIKSLTDSFDKAQQKTEDLSDALKKIGEISAIAFAALAGEGFLAVQAYAKQESAVNSLTQALQNQGIYSQDLLSAYKDTAEELEKKTGVDKESIESGQGVLQGMIGQTKISKELTAAVVDLAAKQKIDLQSAFQLVGKAALGNETAFKKMGISIVDQYSVSANLAEITQKVSDRFHGSAEAATQGLGSYALLKTAYDNLQEAIGEKLAPAVTGIIKGFTGLFTALKENKTLVDFIVSAGVGAGVVALLGTGVGVAGTAFLALKAALAAASIQMEATTLIVKGLAGATGIGLIVLAVTEVYLHWKTVLPQAQAVFQGFVEGTKQLLVGFGEILSGAFHLDPTLIKKGLEDIEGAISKSADTYKTTLATKNAEIEAEEKKHQKALTDANNKGADEREEQRKRADAYRGAIAKAQNELELEKLRQANADVTSLTEREHGLLERLADTHNKAIYGLLDQQLAQVKSLKAVAQANQLAQEEILNNQILASDKKFHAMSLADQQLYIQQHGAQLRQQILTEKTAQQSNTTESLNLHIKNNNQFLKDQQKFGTAYATINKAMHSEIYAGSKSAFGDLAELQNSSNSTLKEIGKVAAAANIAMKTAESAMNIYAGFSTIPIIGPELGIAGAAAAIAYGLEQENNVLSAADGGVYNIGGIPGKDSIRSLYMPGELVVPTRSYEEVVSAVADQRNAAYTPGGGSGEPMEGHLLVTLKDGLMDFIEMNLVQRKHLGISILGAK